MDRKDFFLTSFEYLFRKTSSAILETKSFTAVEKAVTQFEQAFKVKELPPGAHPDPKEFKKALIDLENNYEYYCNSVNHFKLYLNWKNIADYHSNVYNSILVDTKSSKSIQHSSTIATTNTTTTTTVLPINKIKNSIL